MITIKTNPFLIILSLCILSCGSLHAQIKDSVNNVATQTPDSEPVFEKVEVDAEFPGGMEGWKSFLIDKLRPNVPVRHGAPIGTYKVIIRFIVGKDGSLRNLQAETNFGYGMEEECIRVLKKSPKWQPALQNGQQVNAYKRQPITFMVSK